MSYFKRLGFFTKMCQGSQIYILVTGGKLMFLLQGLVLVNLLSGFVLRKCIFVTKYVKKRFVKFHPRNKSYLFCYFAQSWSNKHCLTRF